MRAPGISLFCVCHVLSFSCCPDRNYHVPAVVCHARKCRWPRHVEHGTSLERWVSPNFFSDTRNLARRVVSRSCHLGMVLVPQKEKVCSQRTRWTLKREKSSVFGVASIHTSNKQKKTRANAEEEPKKKQMAQKQPPPLSLMAIKLREDDEMVPHAQIPNKKSATLNAFLHQMRLLNEREERNKQVDQDLHARGLGASASATFRKTWACLSWDLLTSTGTLERTKPVKSGWEEAMAKTWWWLSRPRQGFRQIWTLDCKIGPWFCFARLNKKNHKHVGGPQVSVCDNFWGRCVDKGSSFFWGSFVVVFLTNVCDLSIQSLVAKISFFF